MDIIQQAQAKRESLQREMARIEAFLATAYELQQEFDQGATVTKPQSDTHKADAPARATRSTSIGGGSVTLRAVGEILRERGVPLSTKELLPLVRAKGIEVGGKDALATLSARISQKGLVTVTGGKWWFIGGQQASSGESLGEEAADEHPAKEQSAASLFHSNQGERHNAAALAH